MSELDISIVIIFKQYYPFIDHTTLDNNILAMLIENMFLMEKDKYSLSDSDEEYNEENNDLVSDNEESDNEDMVVEENYSKANELIPDMIESGDLINVRGKLNDIPVNILFDSGCQTSTSFTSIIKKANLEHLIDKKAITYCNNIDGVTNTCGMIWLTELELEINEDNYITVPIKLSILDDSKNIKQEDSDDEFDTTNKIDILLGTDFMKSNNVTIKNKKKIITLNEHKITYK
jgi:hypothetical protein